jgi:hypothetical protein
VGGVDVVARVRLVVLDIEPTPLKQLAKPTSMIGSLRPWAMNARVERRSSNDGLQPSTTGTKPEKARIPAGAGLSPASPSE